MEVRNFQRSLNEDSDEKYRFVNADVEESDSEDSEEEDTEAIKIVPPKKAKKQSHIDKMLMTQLVAQQKAYLRAQKTIYKLRTEIDTEEVKSRYIKLDLNNAQVKIEELGAYQGKYYKSIIVNVIMLVFILYTLFR